MPPRPHLLLAGLLVLASALGAPSAGAVAQETPAPKVTRFIGGQPEAASYLPDTTALAQVGDRVIRIRDFKRGWFNAWQPDLPPPDSSGRAEFLANMVKRDLLALEANRLQIPFGFEQRLQLREYSQRMLADLLFRRAVVDSVRISPAWISAAFPNFRYEIHPRHIQFDDPDTAAAVRAALAGKRITWAAAVSRYSLNDSTRARLGDLGWIKYGNADPIIAIDVWPLKPGVLSPVIEDDDGYHLIEVIERRSTGSPDSNAVRALVHGHFERYQMAQRMRSLQAEMRRRIHLTYEHENIRLAAARFGTNVDVKQGRLGTEMTINEAVPEFSDADTARVLARFDGGVLTLGGFLHEYSHLSALARPQANSPGLMRRAVDNFVLQDVMAEEARRRGLENDPLAVRNLGIKREQLMVERLYQDSVATHVWIPPAERRRFYEEHLAAYFTYPRVRFAALSFKDKAGAEAVAAQLRGGLDVNAVLADTARYGWTHGSIQERRQNDRGPYHKVLFEGLRPGQVTVEGPGSDGSWFVVQLLHYDAGRQLSYEEAQAYVDTDTQNIRSEELLNAFVDRLKRRYPWWSKPELVMGIRLVEENL